MKTNKFLKNISVVAAVVAIGAFTAGCASTQQEQPRKKESHHAAHHKGPSACEKELARAEAARKKAASVGGEWRDIKKIMKKAKKALKGGSESKCLKLASKARRQGELGYAQALSQRSQKTAATSVYTVSRGDSLWSISGDASVYADPYQWPLIYKANRDQIKDADLIYPGQTLDIDRSASSADIDAAVAHARSRGAWAVGVVEDTDKAYLAR